MTHKLTIAVLFVVALAAGSVQAGGDAGEAALDPVELPPGTRGVGACSDGSRTCGEFMRNGTTTF